MGCHQRPAADRRTTRRSSPVLADHYVSGRGGGRDIDLRVLAAQGMRLYGRLTDYVDGELRFRPDLRRSLDRADEISEDIKDGIDKFLAEQGSRRRPSPGTCRFGSPTSSRPRSRWPGPASPGVVRAIGQRADHRWVQLPVFAETGVPDHVRGVTSEPGVFFLGLRRQWTWGSARFAGVGADAEYPVDQITARVPVQSSR